MLGVGGYRYLGDGYRTLASSPGSPTRWNTSKRSIVEAGPSTTWMVEFLVASTSGRVADSPDQNYVAVSKQMRSSSHGVGERIGHVPT